MMSQPGSAAAAIPAPASVVGNAFVNQYYNVLHQSPHVVHRFYTDASRLSRAEAGLNGIVDTVTGQAGINEKVMSLDYGDIRAEIKTVDSQESLSGSVLVMVTGALFGQNKLKRNFVQTFFLAPQEKGYFVLNDMFRYLDEVRPITPIAFLPNGISEVVAAEPVSTFPDQGVESPLPGDESRDYSPRASEEEITPDTHYDIPEQTGVSEIEEVDEPPPVPEEEPVVPLSEQADPPVEEVSGELPKKSYASILRVPKDSLGASTAITPSVQVRNIPANVDRFGSPPAQAAQPMQSMAGTTSSPEELDESSQLDGEDLAGDGRSVYIKNLPFSITAIELEEEFVKFGQIKQGGVNLRNQKPGVCFAFVEYEEAISAQNAIDASPISIGGRQAYIQEKRSMVSRAGRGRFTQGRGYQNEGVRGRGYFGGRGSGRGSWQDSDRGFNRGRGPGMGRGGYGGGNSSSSYSNNANGYRRSDSQDASSTRFSRRGAGNQMGRGGPRGAATEATA